MKHYGDITKINGALVEPVNVVIGGSPCQDLSVAGKQAGLAGERSGLFMEQLRVIKEMRRADLERGRTGKDTRPRYMVWENVPGAFSSTKGADFGAVLQETAKVACEQAPAVPMPKNGWPPAGCLTDMGGQWSIAWRVFDAQFWGVPQRRKRIALVADFGGLTAPEILFERQGVPGYTPQGFRSWQGSAGTAEEGSHPASVGTDGYNGAIDTVAATLGVNCGMPTGRNGDMVLENHPADSRVTLSDDGKVQTLTSRMGTGGNNVPLIMKIRCGCEGVSYTLNTIDRPAVLPFVPAPYCLSAGSSTGEASLGVCEEQSQAQYIVRRFTPLECERLQGFPDGWTDIGEWTDSKGKVHKESTDSARYKALGNSIAIPPWTYVLQRLSLCCGSKPTMASLFDGIGGFPYIWESLNGKGSCVWASEIEDFPIAVTKYHFPEEVNNDG